MSFPPIIILAGIMGGAAVVITVLLVLTRQVSQRRVWSQAVSNHEIAGRLERIERLVEATAIDVERLAESNRFLAKVLGERTTRSDAEARLP